MIGLIQDLITNLGYVVLIAFLVINLGAFKRTVQKEETSLAEKALLSLIFGGFGIMSTYLGIHVHGAVASTRIIGVMAGGILCGPFVGIAAGLIAGVHRFLFDIDGITSVPCATITILCGFASALIFKKVHKDARWLAGLLAGLIAESLEMLLVLLISKPFEEALAIVQIVYLPMSIANSLGIAILVLLITNFFREKEVIAARQSQAALEIARKTLPLLHDVTPESLASTCSIVRESTDAMAVAITDRFTVLAHSGEGSGYSPKGDKPASKAIRRVIEEGRAISLHTRRELSGDCRGCRYNSAVIAPLREGGESVGTLALYFRKEGGISYSNETLAEGLSMLISTQIELSKVGQLRELAAKSELKALQAQINPHFLFNALNTITAFLRADPARARDLIVNLSTYLRYNIEHVEALVDITKELEQVRAYVEIEKARFGKDLNVEFCVDEDLQAKLPSLIIQPLVENAIKHGILEGSGAGTVRVDVRRLDERKVRVSVEDDGVGIPDAVIEGISESRQLNRVGLSNVNSRLLNVYKRGLEIRRLQRGTSVAFTLDELAGERA